MFINRAYFFVKIWSIRYIEKDETISLQLTTMNYFVMQLSNLVKFCMQSCENSDSAKIGGWEI